MKIYSQMKAIQYKLRIQEKQKERDDRAKE